MTDYRAVMDLVLQGWSVRQICSTVRCSHTTVQKARQAMAAHQIATDEQLAGITDEEMATWFVDGRSLAQGDFVPIDFDAVAKARTGRNKVTLQVLWGRYTTQPARPSQRYYSYERFRQLVAEHVDATGLTARITHIPAHTMQVDWAGTTMRLFDPIDARGAKVSIFMASLPYSGMLFACACPNQRQAAWLWAHIQAFEYFGGVAEVIVPDNASTASHAIGVADRNRQVNSTYEEFLEHYNTAALPARARRPKDKANVEAAVKIITQKVIHTLHGHQCVGLDELNARIRSLVDDINDAVPFRGTYTSRRMLFNEFERDVLGQLPASPWQHTEWKRAKVAPTSTSPSILLTIRCPTSSSVGLSMYVSLATKLLSLTLGSVLPPTGLPKPGGSMSLTWIIFLPTWLIPQGCGPVTTSTVKQPRSGQRPRKSSQNSSAQRQSLPKRISRVETY